MPAIGLILVLATSGCSGFQNYTLKSAPARAAVSAGDFQSALATFPDESAQGRDEILIRLERAMLLQDLGLFEQSSAEFEKVSDKIREIDERAVISAGKTASQAGSLMINEQVMPYEGEDFEIVLLHSLNAMNYLLRGDLEGARVEIRRSYERQRQLSEKHEKELQEARKDPLSGDWERSYEQADPHGYGRLKEKAAGAYSVYHNAFASYVSALVYELVGEPDEAYIDLKNAIQAYPSNPSVQRDLLRLSRKLGYKDDREIWQKRFGPAGSIPKDHTDVFVVFSYGLAPYKVPLNLPIPTSHGFVFASLPVYRFSESSIRGGHVVIGELDEDTSTVFDVDAVAARNLLDDFPIIFVKQIMRSYLKARAISSLSKNNSSTGAILGTLFSAVTEHADLRAWSMLPREIHVARLFVPKSARAITINALPQGGSATVEIPEGTRNMIVYCRATENSLATHTKSF